MDADELNHGIEDVYKIPVKQDDVSTPRSHTALNFWKRKNTAPRQGLNRPLSFPSPFNPNTRTSRRVLSPFYSNPNTPIPPSNTHRSIPLPTDMKANPFSARQPRWRHDSTHPGFMRLTYFLLSFKENKETK